MEQALIQQCHKVLINTLNPDKDSGFSALAASIVQLNSKQSLPPVILTILKQGVSPGDLFRALLKCQWIVLEYRLSTLKDLSPRDQVSGLKQTMEHFNHIEESIIESGEQVWVTQLNETKKALDVERQAHVLTVSMNHWKALGKIKLLNYYKGMPVQAVAKILDMHREPGKEMITVRFTDELGRVIAIAPDEASALSPSKNKDALFKFSVFRIGREEIIFSISGTSTRREDTYREVRVQPVKVREIELYRNKKRVVSGQLHDMSIAGIGVQISNPIQLPCSKGDIVDFQIKADDKVVRGSGWVRSFHSDSDITIIGIEIRPEAAVQRFLQEEVSKIQRRIIHELKQKYLFSSIERQHTGSG